MNWRDYERPRSISEALNLLEQAEGRGRVIAGGTDLVLQLRQKRYQADLLVDITGIEALQHIEEREGWIQIGAAVTHAEVAHHDLIGNEARALARGCSQVGSPQIRQMATLVGNIISAQPAADGAIPLMALEAEIQVAAIAGERWLPLPDAYRGLGLSTVDAKAEIATAVRFKKLGEHGLTGFFRLARRKALALPTLNGAVALCRDASGCRLQRARISLGPVAEHPFRPQQAEVYLESHDISWEVILEAARIASEEANPRTSLLRGSEEYRKAMIRLYLSRTLGEMLAIP